MKKFFSGLLTTILILIIIGGVGYIGYTSLSGGHAGMNMTGTTSGTSDQNNNNSMNTQSNSSNDQMNMPNNNVQQGGTSQNSLVLVNNWLENKETLDRVIVIIEDSLKAMSLDPYLPKQTNDTNNVPVQQENGQATDTPGTTTNTQGNTTINVYTSVPQTQTGNSVMTSMGTTYDANKMEQLHTGIYKISTGMQLLAQLRDDYTMEAEIAGGEIKIPAQYYSNQYYFALQNKNKLSQAMLYINEAANLVNVNPYASVSGAVFDKDNMKQIHESVFKLAQAVVELNKLNDNMTKQAINYSNLAQNYADMSQMNMGTMNAHGTGLLDNVNISSIANILLIVFAFVFVIGIFGFIASLFKSPKPQVEKTNLQ